MFATLFVKSFMSNKNIIVGLDIGSTNIKIAVAEDDTEQIKIIGADKIESAGVRRGSIVDVEDVAGRIGELLGKIENRTDRKIKNILLGVGGTEIKMQNAKGVVAIGRANGEVADDDVQRVLEAAQNSSMPINSEIIHILPKEYKLDDQAGVRNPVGMSGIRLETEALLLEDNVNHLGNLIKSVELSGLQAEDLIINSLGASSVFLDKNQKELGVALIDIGGGTTSITVFEEGELVNIAVLPIGAGHITNDIAIGLRVSVDLAERVKIKYGSAFPNKVNKRENIDLSEIDAEEDGLVSRYYVAEIIEARVKEIFDMVNDELKKMGKAGLLPAGIVLVGGGAELPNIVELAKNRLNLPVKKGYPLNIGGVLNEVDSPIFATAVGLIKYWRDSDISFAKRGSKSLNIFSKLNISGSGDTGKKIKNWMDKFLP